MLHLNEIFELLDDLPLLEWLVDHPEESTEEFKNTVAALLAMSED